MLALIAETPSNEQRAFKIRIAENDLIFGVRAGDRKAITVLYDNYAAALYGIIKRVVHADEVAEDILQDTFVKIWKTFSQYDPSKGKLFTWMANTARNLAIDQVRSKYHRNNKDVVSLNDEPKCMQVVYNATKSTDVIGLKALTSELKKDVQDIIDLIYFQGYTHVEVAEHLHIPVGTVKTRLRLGMKTLKKFFN